MSERFETVVGLEVHAQLQTQSKLFASPSVSFGADVNAQVSEICLGLPGVLPVLNQHAVELAARAGFGLNCTVHAQSEWSRKHYFYADLPKGYQITQFEHPIATGGYLDIEVDDLHKRIDITRIHMEEDAGKSVHDVLGATGKSCLDYNRAGVPLVEIVTEPDFRSPHEASDFLRRLRELLLFLGVCDGNMEEGSLRCDANVSVRPLGEKTLGTRCEIKNLNSFRFVEAAIEYEALRQQTLIQNGGEVAQETRLWDTANHVTRTMRSKEDAHDYRYFPDPDLPILNIAEDELDRIRETLPERPQEKRNRYTEALHLSTDAIHVLLSDPRYANFFDRIAKQLSDVTLAANWTVNDIVPAFESGLAQLDDEDFPESLVALLTMISTKKISQKAGKTVLAKMFETGDHPHLIVEREGLEQVSDASAIESAVDEVLANNPQSAADYRAGKTKVIGFLVGQVMKASKGRANPQMVSTLLKEKLGD